MDKFSDNFSNNISNEVVLKLKEQLCSYGVQNEFLNSYSILETPNKLIAISTNIKLDVGSDSLLKSNEPIIIEFSNIDDIERSSINVYPDRTDFPFELLPHINYAIEEMPPSICLSRENFTDWYAEHSFDDLLRRIQKWFEDAVKGNLIKLKEGDFYEPFRVAPTDTILFKDPWEDSILENKDYCGSIIYPIKRIEDGVEAYNATIGGKDFTGEGLGVLLFKSNKSIDKEWYIKRPKTIGELFEFITKHHFHFDTNKIIQTINRYKCDKIRQIFFQLAFVRPCLVLNKSTRIDYLYFSLKYQDLLDSNNNAPIKGVCAFDFATINLARHISATSKNIAERNILILGCGAIGSKLAYHLYRSGICNLTICDNDILASHNVCRHALAKCAVLTKKVDLVKKELDQMFHSNPQRITAISENILTWLPNQDLDNYDLIIEATASTSVFRLLDYHSRNCNVPIVRFALTNAGKIGLMYIKYNRDNILSDYDMQIATEACNNEDIHNWLEAEDKYDYDFVRVGDGCHSNTMILSDDSISTHCGIASKIIRNMFDGAKLQNTIHISYTDVEYMGQVFTDKLAMPRFVNIECANNCSWNIRINSNVLKEILHNTRVSKKRETGGYLMGAIDVKYKTIYILHQFTPYRIEASQTQLKLSTDGWENDFNKYHSGSNNMINYIGDWHSHPMGTLLSMSNIDKETCTEVHANEINYKYGICVITNAKIPVAYLLKK